MSHRTDGKITMASAITTRTYWDQGLPEPILSAFGGLLFASRTAPQLELCSAGRTSLMGIQPNSLKGFTLFAINHVR
jgi:hypothetical protein